MNPKSVKRQKTLSHARLLEMLFYDPKIGNFTWKKSPKGGNRAGALAGYLGGGGYWHIALDRRSWCAHRLAWFYIHAVFPLDDIDHINRNPRDNRIENLRLATRTQNQGNKCTQAKKAIRQKGVYLRECGKKYRAIIQFMGKRKHLGSHETIDEAAHAYNKAAVEIFGEFALLNPIGVDYES